jgi:hypothetical protein
VSSVCVRVCVCLHVCVCACVCACVRACVVCPVGARARRAGGAVLAGARAAALAGPWRPHTTHAQHTSSTTRTRRHTHARTRTHTHARTHARARTQPTLRYPTSLMSRKAPALSGCAKTSKITAGGTSNSHSTLMWHRYPAALDTCVCVCVCVGWCVLLRGAAKPLPTCAGRVQDTCCRQRSARAPLQQLTGVHGSACTRGGRTWPAAADSCCWGVCVCVCVHTACLATKARHSCISNSQRPCSAARWLWMCPSGSRAARAAATPLLLARRPPPAEDCWAT